MAAHNNYDKKFPWWHHTRKATGAIAIFIDFFVDWYKEEQ